MELKRRAVWSGILVTLVVSLIGTYVERAEADDGRLKVKITTDWSNTIGCNATMNAACSEEEEEEEEFLKDSESNRRLLAVPTNKLLNGLQKPKICDATRYGSCISNALHGTNKKPCSLNYRSCR